MATCVASRVALTRAPALGRRGNMPTQCASCGETVNGGQLCPACGSPQTPDTTSSSSRKSLLRSPWPLVALGLVTLVLASMALYKTLRPSEISLAQMAAHAGDVECTDSQGRVLSISSDGTWSGLEMQGTWTASGDTLEISGEDATRTLALKISGISGVSLERDRLPITWTFDGQTGEFGLDALGDQDQPVGCRRV